jgi:glyoxylase-like metal-dependent hydrolase (beta-lactamase superfamily II)
VREAARGRLEPHDLAEAVADATSKDVTASLMDIAKMRLFSAGILFGRLPDETWVYPGHGKDTTLGAERPHLAEWRERGW